MTRHADSSARARTIRDFFLENTSDGFVLLDATGLVRAAHAAARLILGHDLRHLLDPSLADFRVRLRTDGRASANIRLPAGANGVRSVAVFGERIGEELAVLVREVGERRADEPSVPPSPRPPALPRGTETVLVADDDDGVRGVVRAALSDLGYRVIAAHSGEDAMLCALREKAPIDLAIVDVVMPYMNGREVVEKLRLAGHAKKALFISGHADRSVEENGVRSGADPILRKPFSATELARAVRATLDAGAKA
jgi:CheY-like chemotaxis protein